MKNIYLIGMPASGKTTLGKKLSMILSKNFMDTDTEIEKMARMSVADFFARYGEIPFRELEKDVMLRSFELKNYVVATGGGLPAYSQNMNLLLANGVVAYMDTPLPKLIERMRKEPAKRPLFPQENIGKILENRLKEREPYYNRAHLVIKPSDDLYACASYLAELLNSQTNPKSP